MVEPHRASVDPARVTGTIGVVSPLVGGFYFGAIIAGVTRAAARAGMRVVAVQTFPTRLARERHPSEPLPGEPGALGAVDGIVVITNALEPPRLSALLAGDRPVVLVGTDTTEQVPVLRPDNAAGARAAVEHLIQHGHSRIGFAGDLTQGDIRERHEAYLATLAAHGITPEPDWFHPGENSIKGGLDAADTCVAAGIPTTATLAATDLTAIGMLRGLQRAGIALPRDQAVIGFDHTEGAGRLRPRLSTVDPHPDRLGELAVDHLLARMRGTGATPPTRVSPTLVTRESCGCSRVATVCTDHPAPGSSTAGTSGSAGERLAQVAATAFAGVRHVRGVFADDATARGTWVDSVLAVISSAAERGQRPSSATLRRLRDLTTALTPYSETLEQLITAVRRVEHERADRVTDAEHRDALHRAVSDLLIALTQGCMRPYLVREAGMERTIAEQYEVDMDVTAFGESSPRNLTWLPESGQVSACVGLWTQESSPTGERTVEVVGAVAPSGTPARSVGRRIPAAQFPPQALLRGGAIDGTTLVFVVPVVSSRKDWGLLAVAGRLDSRMTYSRERHQHWGALLAASLDHEEMLTELRSRSESLEHEAQQAGRAVEAMRQHHERAERWRQALRHGLWDWDVSSGSVHWSPQWAENLGLRQDSLTDSPAEWLDRVHPADRPSVSAMIAAHLGGSPGRMRIEHRVRHASGEYRWMLCKAMVVTDDTGAPSRLFGALVDITEQRAREEAAARGVFRDPATGLVNRAAFLDRLQDLVDAPADRDDDVSVAVLQIAPTDGGLPGPDSAVADAVVALAAEVRRVVGRGDFAGRSASDALAVALVDRAGESGGARLEALLDALPAQHRNAVAVGFVAGVGAYETAEDAFRAAEASVTWNVPGAARR